METIGAVVPRLAAIAEQVPLRGPGWLTWGPTMPIRLAWLPLAWAHFRRQATDVREGPLQRGRVPPGSIRWRTELSPLLRGCDGLAAVEPQEADGRGHCRHGGELMRPDRRTCPGPGVQIPSASSFP
ncbi:MAG: hypothetical protein ACLR1T_02220 [Evtepia gabavorous]